MNQMILILSDVVFKGCWYMASYKIDNSHEFWRCKDWEGGYRGLWKIEQNYDKFQSEQSVIRLRFEPYTSRV
jgi:hypothetical protein